MNVAELPRLWIVTNPDHADGPLPAIARALTDVPAGRVGVQLRAKTVTDRTLIQWGHELRKLTAAARCPLVVNRRADVAQIIGADGVHLPEAGVPPETVKEQWPDFPLVGASRHDREGLLAAQTAGASYAFLSPLFDVPGKGPALGARAWAEAVEDLTIPVFALGGIDADTVSQLEGLPLAGIAVRRAVYESADPQQVIERLLHELDKMAANIE